MHSSFSNGRRMCDPHSLRHRIIAENIDSTSRDLSAGQRTRPHSCHYPHIAAHSASDRQRPSAGIQTWRFIIFTDVQQTYTKNPPACCLLRAHLSSNIGIRATTPLPPPFFILYMQIPEKMRGVNKSQ